MSSLHQGFQETGALAETFRWLDQADGHPLVQELKRHILEVGPVGAGDRVLDVGCGLGQEALRLAQRTGSQGHVTGIDANPAMIAEARRRSEDGDLPVTFEIGDAQSIALPDGTFDICRTERVLRYLDRPDAAIAEMTRVTRPGGSVVAFDFDSDMTVVDLGDPLLVRQITDVLDAAVPHPWIGRQLFARFRRAGLHDVRAVPHAFCLTGKPGFTIYQQLNRGTIDRAWQTDQISADQAAAWWRALEPAAEEGAFFAATLGFIVAGRKPIT